MDKRITLQVTNAKGEDYTVTGWLEDWILALYDSMPEDQRVQVRKELRRREEREKRK